MKIKPGDRFLIPSIEREYFAITILRIDRLIRRVECMPDNIMLPTFYLKYKQIKELKKI